MLFKARISALVQTFAIIMLIVDLLSSQSILWYEIDGESQLNLRALTGILFGPVVLTVGAFILEFLYRIWLALDKSVQDEDLAK